jgi:MFS family permease
MKAFESRAFRWLWCSSLALSGAQLMERVTTNWLALEAGGGALGVGIVLAARMAPFLLLGLPVGTLADRLDRRRLLLGVTLAAALLMLGLRALVGSGVAPLGAIAGIAWLAGCLQVSDTPARQALIVDAVGRRTAPSAIAWNAVATRLFGAVGALAGGLAIPLVGVANSYTFVAAGYLMSFLLLAAVRVRDPVETPAEHPPFGRALGGAARLVLDDPAVRTLVLAAMACEVFGFSYLTAVPSLARDVLGAGAEGFGALTAASAIGSTVSVVLLAVRIHGPGTRREALLAVDYLLYGASIVGLALAPTLPLAEIAMLLVGGFSAAFDALQQTLLQLAVPEEQRGRAGGIWTFSIGTAPIGHLEVGALAAWVGTPGALLVNGALVALGALVLVARAPRYRLPWPSAAGGGRIYTDDENP